MHEQDDDEDQIAWRVEAEVKAIHEEAARKEAALQAALDEARAAAAAAAGGGSGGSGGGSPGDGGGGGRDLAALLAEKEAELDNLQAALGELSYEADLADLLVTALTARQGSTARSQGLAQLADTLGLNPDDRIRLGITGISGAAAAHGMGTDAGQQQQQYGSGSDVYSPRQGGLATAAAVASRQVTTPRSADAARSSDPRGRRSVLGRLARVLFGGGGSGTGGTTAGTAYAGLGLTADLGGTGTVMDSSSSSHAYSSHPAAGVAAVGGYTSSVLDNHLSSTYGSSSVLGGSGGAAAGMAGGGGVGDCGGMTAAGYGALGGLAGGSSYPQGYGGLSGLSTGSSAYSGLYGGSSNLYGGAGAGSTGGGTALPSVLGSSNAASAYSSSGLGTTAYGGSGLSGLGVSGVTGGYAALLGGGTAGKYSTAS
eukprot:gene2541-2843_t